MPSRNPTSYSRSETLGLHREGEQAITPSGERFTDLCNRDTLLPTNTPSSSSTFTYNCRQNNTAYQKFERSVRGDRRIVIFTSSSTSCTSSRPPLCIQFFPPGCVHSAKELKRKPPYKISIPNKSPKRSPFCRERVSPTDCCTPCLRINQKAPCFNTTSKPDSYFESESCLEVEAICKRCPVSDSYIATDAEGSCCVQALTLNDLAGAFADHIVRDDRIRSGFAVIYPGGKMEGGTGDEAVSTLSRSSTGTQLGEGILKDSIYSTAVQFAEQHGYGFVEFVDDQLPKRPYNRSKEKSKRNHFSHVIVNRDERMSVVKKEVRSPIHRSRSTKCSANPDAQREGLLSHFTYLDNVERSLASVENIASQISEMRITDCQLVTPRGKKSSDSKRSQSQTPDVQSVPEATLNPPENDDEIIRSAPLNQYREYLSKVCESIYQAKEGEQRETQEFSHPTSKESAKAGDTMPYGPSALKEGAVSAVEPESGDKQDAGTGLPVDVHKDRKKKWKRRDNNNNVSKEGKKGNGRDHPAAEDHKKSLGILQDNVRGFLPKPSKGYRCSQTLSSRTSSPELESAACSEPSSNLGVRFDSMKGKMEIVRYNCLQSASEADDRDVSNFAKLPGTSQDQKTPQISSSSSRTSPARALKLTQPGDNSSSRQLPSGTKSVKHDHGVCSCPDLLSSQVVEVREFGRNKELCTIQRSPTRESAKRCKGEIEPEMMSATSTARAQGDMKTPPSFIVNARPQDQGDAEISPKESSGQQVGCSSTGGENTQRK